ncbi:M14 family metallopeptidase [Candidatus Uabimicrobium amorphum]|uniref:Peptidase M14 n=1 Tax=Uabimicrobium amorphum TaxID=2596890 RepID=A0A5S9ITA5_UABAM|nr:M14 family metallopeptidase [Candidatus Uabimicrobium amorphum]BBM87534.1 peptidase M14 [Candidatus Uabimicrobium amorphum]
MRKYVIILLLLCASVTAQVQLDYYLPQGEYDKNIPTPQQFLGYQVGEWHVSHDQLVYYIKKLGELSERFNVQEYARSYEARPLIVATITSTDNHQNIEEIQQRHRSLRSGNDIDVSTMPAVVYIGHSIHGNEPSGSNAALIAAYFLAAAQGEEVEKMLQNTIILLDPCMNPDGFNRFASWVNTHKSKKPTAAAICREHNEVWPRGRTNHYWFDLNRDWLLTQHPESRGRVKIFQQWQPNILTDHHEMGTQSTYFFQPGVPKRTHPLTPQKNQILTKKIAHFHAKTLDKIGSLYYSEERFDDFYYGKGSTYPDVQGAVGILFEQASSRGHLQESVHGDVSFPFTIRNQVKTIFSTLEAAQNLRVELLSYRRNFYSESRELAQKDEIKAYIISDNNDKKRLTHFAQLLQRHKIDVFHLAKPITVDSVEYTEENSLLVPTHQSQYRLIKSLFERRTSFADTIFYDVSAWTMPMAFHLSFAELKNKAQLTYLQGENYQYTFTPPQTTFDEKAYAYLFTWDGYYAPRALNRLLQLGAKVKVATKEFSAVVNGAQKRFTYGTILVPMGIQTDKKQIAHTMETIASEDHVAVYRAETGFTPVGMDLGSGNFRSLQPPKTVMLAGKGVNAYDAGEVWHLFDVRFNIPLVVVDVDDFSSLDMHKYNTMVMVDGSYNLSSSDTQKLQDWVKSGGNLIAAKRAINWAVSAQIAPLQFVTPESTYTDRLPYISRVQNEGSQITGGAILEGKTDLTHPLLYGYHHQSIHLFRRGNMAIKKPKNVYSVPIVYTDNPLASGYMSKENQQLIKSTPAIVVCGKGRGKVICMADNLNFRAFWYGTNKIFINGVLFGRIIDNGSVEK